MSAFQSVPNRHGECGSPSLSLYLWCRRWSATQVSTGPSMARLPAMASAILKAPVRLERPVGEVAVEAHADPHAGDHVEDQRDHDVVPGRASPGPRPAGWRRAGRAAGTATKGATRNRSTVPARLRFHVRQRPAGHGGDRCGRRVRRDHCVRCGGLVELSSSCILACRFGAVLWSGAPHAPGAGQMQIRLRNRSLRNRKLRHRRLPQDSPVQVNSVNVPRLRLSEGLLPPYPSPGLDSD